MRGIKLKKYYILTFKNMVKSSTLIPFFLKKFLNLLSAIMFLLPSFSPRFFAILSFQKM